MDITQFLIEEGLFIVPVLWVLGYFLKETPKMENWLIPYILLVIGIILAVWTLGFTAEGFAQGVLVTGAAVLGHQLFAQAKHKETS